MHVWIGALDTALQPHEADCIEAQGRKLRHAFSNDLDLVVCRLCLNLPHRLFSLLFAALVPYSPLTSILYTPKQITHPSPST